MYLEGNFSKIKWVINRLSCNKISFLSHTKQNISKLLLASCLLPNTSSLWNSEASERLPGEPAHRELQQLQVEGAGRCAHPLVRLWTTKVWQPPTAAPLPRASPCRSGVLWGAQPTGPDPNPPILLLGFFHLKHTRTLTPLQKHEFWRVNAKTHSN